MSPTVRGRKPFDSMASASPTPDPHPLIAGFRIGDEMGSGPLGKVYRAEHVETGYLVVFRGFTQPADADTRRWQAAKTQFKQLLAAHQRVPAHPNIQQIIGFGEEDDLFWVATEYFEGRTLHALLGNGGARSRPWAVEALRQIGAAVDWAREKGGLAHTDLTPYNILVVPDADGSLDRFQVKVINFGLAHARHKFGSRHAAPEQMENFEGDSRSDVYAAGTLLYEMLSGRPIYQASDARDMAAKITLVEPPPLSTQPAYVRQVVGSMLNKNPDLRPTTISVAVTALQQQRAEMRPGARVDTGGAPNFAAPFPLAPTQPESQATPASRTEHEGQVGDRFARLELDGGSRVAPSSPPPPSEPPVRPEPIGLQDYQLSAQDLVLIRWRLEERRREAAERLTRRRVRAIRFGRFGLAAVAFLAVVLHAKSQVNAYRYLTVSGLTGTAKLFHADGDAPTQLRVGDRIQLPAGVDATAEAAPTVTITTGPDSRILLDSRGARLHLQENSALVVRELGYQQAPIRRFRLTRGAVVADVDPNHRAGAVFEIAAGSIRAFAKGTRFGVLYTPARSGSVANAGTARVRVATSEGAVRVVSGDGEREVPAGKQLSMAPDASSSTTEIDMPTTEAISASASSALASGAKGMSRVKSPFGIAADLADNEEKLLLPVIEVGSDVVHLPTVLNDRRAQVLAVGSMQALCVLVQTEIGDQGAPASVNLSTLEELGMSRADRKRILDQFEGAHLTSYRPLADGGYEFVARARDSNHTLVRARNGAASIVGNDDAELTVTGTAPVAP